MQTIGTLAQSCGLSRSTLLYYDKIGLLTPSGHAKGAYRYYSDADQTRLQRICEFRSAGLSLESIRTLLDADTRQTGELEEIATVLETRLLELNSEILLRRSQQRLVAILLGKLRSQSQANSGIPVKQDWVDLLKAAGFNDDDMMQWHRDFEKTDPDAHHAFLRALKLSPAYIRKIRESCN